MHRPFCLISFFVLVSVETAFSAFEGENNVILQPPSAVHSFVSSDYFLEKRFIFTSTGSRLYSMPECNKVETGILNNFPLFTLGADISFFGSELYNETAFALSFLKGTKHLFGIRMKIMRLAIKGYRGALYGSDDLIFISQNKFFYFQSTYYNAVSCGSNSDEEKPISSFCAILRLYPGDWNSLNIKINFSALTGTTFEMGNGIRLTKNLNIGGGFNLSSRTISGSFLFHLGFFDLTYAISDHPELGLTSAVGLTFTRDKKKLAIE